MKIMCENNEPKKTASSRLHLKGYNTRNGLQSHGDIMTFLLWGHLCVCYDLNPNIVAPRPPTLPI